MQPEQSYAPPDQPDQYSFIMGHGDRQGGLGQLNRKMVIILAIVGAILLMIAVAVASTLLSSGSKKSVQQLSTLAQEQNELIRVADIGIKKARGSNTQNYASNIKLAMESDQLAIVNNLKSKRHKLTAKELSLKKNTATDTQLTTADQSNNFDAAFVKTMQTQLNSYQSELKTAYDAETGAKTKKLYSDMYNHATTLLTTATLDK